MDSLVGYVVSARRLCYVIRFQVATTPRQKTRNFIYTISLTTVDRINHPWAHQNRRALDHYTAIRLVHWPLTGGLLHLVQRGGFWAGCGPNRPMRRGFFWKMAPTRTPDPSDLPPSILYTLMVRRFILWIGGWWWKAEMSYDMQKGESEREGEMSGRGICPGKYVWIPCRTVTRCIHRMVWVRIYGEVEHFAIRYVEN